MAAERHPRELAGAGVRIVLPGKDDREFIEHTIDNELALGQVSAETRQCYLDICARHIETDGIDSLSPRWPRPARLVWPES